MPYFSNQINQANQNLVKGNVLQDGQLGTINTSGSDVTKTADKVSRCELLNSNSGSANGDAVNNSAGTNPVKTVLSSPVYGVTLQNQAQTFAYPTRASQPTF
jgi:hypothetical protein